VEEFWDGCIANIMILVQVALNGTQDLDGRSILQLFMCCNLHERPEEALGLFLLLPYSDQRLLSIIAIESSSCNHFIPHTLYGTMSNPGRSNATTMHVRGAMQGTLSTRYGSRPTKVAHFTRES